MNMKKWMAIGVMGGLLTQAGAAPDAEIAAKPPEEAKASAAVPEVQSLLASGRQALTEGKWAEGVALFEKARKLEPTNPEADFGLSSALIGLDRLAEAMPLLESLRKIAPDNPMVMNNLAWVYAKAEDPKLRNPDKAIKLARAALLELPADYSIWNTLGEAYYAAGQFNLALRAAESAMRLARMAGVTHDDSSRELMARCRRAGKDSAVGKSEDVSP
jgi:Flp pilus assembly protein TadD